MKYGPRPKGGRPPYDPVMMFKVLVLATLHGQSDDRMEFLIRDRLSWMRFLGLHLGETTPDAKTIWLYREKLTKAGAFKQVFEAFGKGSMRRPCIDPLWGTFRRHQTPSLNRSSG